jgi:hypothetical protein
MLALVLPSRCDIGRCGIVNAVWCQRLFVMLVLVLRA